MPLTASKKQFFPKITSNFKLLLSEGVISGNFNYAFCGLEASPFQPTPLFPLIPRTHVWIIAKREMNDILRKTWKEPE